MVTNEVVIVSDYDHGYSCGRERGFGFDCELGVGRDCEMPPGNDDTGGHNWFGMGPVGQSHRSLAGS